MFLLPAAQGWALRTEQAICSRVPSARPPGFKGTGVKSQTENLCLKAQGPWGHLIMGAWTWAGRGGPAVARHSYEAQGACPVHPEQMAWGTFSDVWPIHDFPGRFLKFLFIPVTTFSRNHIHRESSRRLWISGLRFAFPGGEKITRERGLRYFCDGNLLLLFAV